MVSINQKIPEGWSVKKLGEVFDTTTDYVAAGSFADLRDKVNYLDIPSFAQLVRTVDIKNNFNNDGFVYINQSAYDFLWRVHLDEESIILPNIGANIGEVYFLSPGKLPYSKSALGPNAILLRSSKENLFYLYCFCQTVCFRNLLDLIVGASGQPKFNKTDLKTIEILLPPLPEQEKIAGILGTWDEAIEKLSNLIEQKKLLKKGLMQRLLTGKTRLKGFAEPWVYKLLFEVCEFNKGKQLNKEDMLETGLYPVLNGGISYSGYTNDWNTKENIITISEGGNSCGFVNFIKERFWCGGHCYTVSNVQTDIMFLYHLLKFNETNIMKLRVGSGLPNIQIFSLSRFKVYLPTDIAEQQAIANILSTADDEINLLNQKLDALKEQKKGLMQQLLTGQTRVKVN